MDEVRVVRRRTFGWPVVIAIIILAIVIAWAFFGLNVESEPSFGLRTIPGEAAPQTHRS